MTTRVGRRRHSREERERPAAAGLLGRQVKLLPSGRSCSLGIVMKFTCHRCDGDLPGDALRGFCPTCGAPQLRFETEGETAEDPEASSGTAPPPRPREINWPLGMRCAVGVALGTSLVFAVAFFLPYLGLPCLLLLFGASFLTVGLYRRRLPGAVMTAGVGAKLGFSTGVLLMAGLAVALSAVMCLARYRTHTMDAFDAQWKSQVTELLDRTRANSPVPPEAERQMQAPEFRAGSMLAGLVLLGGFLVVISAGSGAFAGSIAVQQRAKR